MRPDVSTVTQNILEVQAYENDSLLKVMLSAGSACFRCCDADVGPGAIRLAAQLSQFQRTALAPRRSTGKTRSRRL